VILNTLPFIVFWNIVFPLWPSLFLFTKSGRKLVIRHLTLEALSVVLIKFWWDWSVNSGLCSCQARALPLESHLQSILLWLFWSKVLA
jgi:hypothetical protein